MKNKLRYLYVNSLNGIAPSIDMSGLAKAVTKGWLTAEDAVEIVGEDNALVFLKTAKLKEISEACNTTIVSGIDVELDSGVAHFNLSIEDQNNISALFRVVELGGTEFPYQADGGVSRIFTAAEITKVYAAAQTFITTQITYHNTLKSYVQSLESAEDIAAIAYGMDLPADYASEMAEKLSVAQAQIDAIVNKVTV